MRKVVKMGATGFNNASDRMRSNYVYPKQGKQVMLLPENMNKPFIKRFIDWWK